MRARLLGRNPCLGGRIVQPLQPRVWIDEPPAVAHVAALQIDTRLRKLQGRNQLLHQVILGRRAESSLRLAVSTPIRGTAPRSAGESSRDALSACSVGTRKSGTTGSSTSRI